MLLEKQNDIEPPTKAKLGDDSDRKP
jgi:hypothetical protein